MPHQCVRCNKFYEDGAQEILEGCSCGARLFFYIKKEKLEETKNIYNTTLEILNKAEEDGITKFTVYLLAVVVMEILAGNKIENCDS